MPQSIKFGVHILIRDHHFQSPDFSTFLYYFVFYLDVYFALFYSV